jgi:GDP-L-fucose synthase
MSKGFFPEEIRDYYRGKSVVVVGGAGFVGQQLARLLALARAKVLVIDDFSRGSTKIPTVKYNKLDAGGSEDYMEMVEIFQETDVVFNLAAVVAGVLHNQNNHLPMYHHNLRVLTVPAFAAHEARTPVFLQTSSVCVYAPEHNSPSDECCGMMGVPHPANAGYAEAKRDGERVALWADDIGRVVIVRPSNIAGPGDYFDELAHVIPAFVKRAFNNRADFVLYGDPYATREFIHPIDVANGMMYAAALGKNGEAYNIGTNGDTTISVKGLAELILAHAETASVARGIPFRMPELKVDPTKGGGDAKRWSDSTKLNSLGWSASLSLETIVRHCIEDYLDFHYRKDPWFGATA